MIRALVERLPVMVTPRWVRYAHPADRDRGPARLPPRGARPRAATSGECSRSAAPTVCSYVDLMREYARPARPPAADGPRAGADAAPLEPLARARDPALRARRAEAHRQHAQRDRRARPRRRSRSFPVRPRGYARGDRPGPRQRGPRVRGDPLVGRALAGGRAARLRRASASARGSSTRAASRVAAPPRGRVRADPADRRRHRAGTSATRCGACAALLDLLVGGVGLRRGRRDPAPPGRATRSTSGASRPSSPDRLLRLAPR